MPKGLVVPKRRLELPPVLLTKGSDIDVVITFVGDGDPNQYGFSSVVRLARSSIKQQCNMYRPSQVGENPNEVLCMSGEIDGTPFRGEVCHQCLAGQFSTTGHFIGEMKPKTQLEQFVEELQNA